MRLRIHAAALVAGVLLGACTSAIALNPSLDVIQYAHTAWTTRDGFVKGNIYAIAQTPDGYLWLGTEFGLFRFDGVRSVHWEPPAGESLPDQNINALLAGRDGTLWIGTFAGLASWKDGKLTRYPQLERRFVESLYEDRDGTVWVGALFSANTTSTGLLCAIRNGSTQCYGKDGIFGVAVPGVHQDRSGNLWVVAASGLFRWKPVPQARYATTPQRVSTLAIAGDGRPLIAVEGAGLLHLDDGKVRPYPVLDPSGRLLSDRDIDANKLLLDRDGGLWIGTVERGLIHVHNGRTDVFRNSNGLSGDVILALFEDREGNVWVSTTGGLDRFRELPVTTFSVEEGLSSDATQSVIAAADGSVWMGSHEGLTRWKDGRATIFRTPDGLPGDEVQAIYQDSRGQIWAATDGGLAVSRDRRRFTAVDHVRGREVFSIVGDESGNLWLSETQGLFHLRNGHEAEHFTWQQLGRSEQVKVLLYDHGGLWLGFWTGGGVSYFKDGRIRESFTAANGLGEGHVSSLRMDPDGALWVSTQGGGLSRIKDRHIATLSTRNGLPCDSVHWTMEDNDRSLWLYTACGLLRIKRPEVAAWIADPRRRVQTTVWDSADGVRLRSSAATPYGPPVATSTDGRIWFVTGEGVDVVDPHHLAANPLPPPVHVEQIIADHKVYWQNLTDGAAPEIRLPPLVHDLTIDYTALSLAAPEKVHFRYKLVGQDRDWREVVDDREVQYSNLAPGPYRFLVTACNNSGVWNTEGDALQFSIAPAYYQTDWFIALCVACLVALLWVAYLFRMRQVRQELLIGVEARIHERTRIARDLHDTLLQSFHGLLYRFQAVRYMLPDNPKEAVEALDSAITRTEQALAEGRNSIQGLRAELFADNDLDQRLIAISQEAASHQEGLSGSPTFKVIVEGERRKLAPVIQEEILRTAQELVQNAFRHANAQAVEAEIRYGRRTFDLIVRDDGKGIDSQILKAGGRPGHWGMPGVRERARGIGARVEFWSEAGAGTEVRLTIPASVAYDKQQNDSRFRLFRKWRNHDQPSRIDSDSRG